MSTVGDKGEPTSAGPQCPQCHAAFAPEDRFCRSCGSYLRDDAKAIDAYLAKAVPERIDAALATRFKDQKIVEVETAEKLAERAMNWLKLAGFFIAIPLVVCGAVLSFLGIKTYSSLEEASQKATSLQTLVSNAEKQFGGLPKRMEELDAQAKSAKSQLDEQIKQIDARQKTLQAQVSNIQERLKFCPAKGLSAEMKNQIQEKLGKYIGYLEKLGFQNLDGQVSVCVYSKDDPIRDDPAISSSDFKNAFYMPDRRIIYIHQDMASVPSVALREYTHYALAQAANRSDYGAAVTEIESGLADYLPSSFTNDPLIGDGLGKLFHLPTSYLRDLSNTARYDTAQDESHARGEIWAAALWQCRAEIGADTLDKIVLQVWRDTNKVASPNLNGFGAALVKSEAATGGKTKCLSRRFTERRIPN